MSAPAASRSSVRRRGRPGHGAHDVLAAAITLFNERGYDATSVGDIAAALGVTKSAIYHHFASKEVLLGSALDEALAGLDDAVERAAREQRGEPAIERLRATVAAAVRILVAHQPAVTLLLRVRGNNELERAALARRRRIDEAFAGLVREAAAAGDLRADVDADVLARLVFGTVNSLVDWYRPGGRLDADALADAVTGVLFEGLRAG